MARGFWMAVGFALPIVLCCGGGYYVMVTAVGVASDNAKKFGDEVTETVTRKPGWDSDALYRKGDTHFQMTYSVAALKSQLLDAPASTLGTFVKGTSTCKTIAAASGDKASFSYSNKVEFSKGKATIVMEIIVQTKGHFAVKSFDIKPE